MLWLPNLAVVAALTFQFPEPWTFLKGVLGSPRTCAVSKVKPNGEYWWRAKPEGEWRGRAMNKGGKRDRSVKPGRVRGESGHFWCAHGAPEGVSGRALRLLEAHFKKLWSIEVIFQPPYWELVCCKWSTLHRCVLGISRAIGRCMSSTGSAVCLINHQKIDGVFWQF